MIFVNHTILIGILKKSCADNETSVYKYYMYYS